MTDRARKTFIQNTEKFIETEQNWLQNTLNSIGWSLQDLTNLAETESHRGKLVSCPIRSEHRMFLDSLDSHLINCEKKYSSYPEMNDDHLTCVFSSHSSTRSHDALNADQESISENRNEKQSEQPSTSKDLAELLNAERDAKRRRAAHRGKRVHSNKKSYSEILRELIANQMVALTDKADVEDEVSAKLRNDPPESLVKKVTYLGVGDSYFPGNPYTRWMTIEQEEENCSKTFEKSTNSRLYGNKASIFSKPGYSRGADTNERRKNSVEVRINKPSHDVNYGSRMDRRESRSHTHDKSRPSRNSDLRRDSRRERSAEAPKKRTTDSNEQDFRKEEFSRHRKNVLNEYCERTMDFDRSKNESRSKNFYETQEVSAELRNDSTVLIKKEECELKSEHVPKKKPDRYQKRCREQSSSSPDSEEKYGKKKKTKKHKKNKKRKKQRRSSSS